MCTGASRKIISRSVAVISLMQHFLANFTILYQFPPSEVQAFTACGTLWAASAMSVAFFTLDRSGGTLSTVFVIAIIIIN